MTFIAVNADSRPHSQIVWALIAGVLVLHCYALFLPFVNQEAAFNQAAIYFRGGSDDNIRAFFVSEANSVVVSAVGAALSFLFRFSADYGARVLSYLCLAGFVAALYAMFAGFSRQHTVYGVALIVLNPLVWTFAGRGTADFAPMALAVMSIALFWRAQSRPITVVLAALLFAFAALTKVHVVLLMPLVALSPEAQDYKRRGILLGAAFAASLVAVATYNVAVFHSFGFWFTPPQFASLHSPTMLNVGNNFVRYAGYLALLALPFSVALAFDHSSRRTVLLKLGAICLGLALGLVLPASVGEMNFGPFDRWIGGWFAGTVLSALFVVLVMSLLAVRKSWIDRGMVLALLMVLLALSVSRPAQRYLLLILPFYYLMIFRAGGIRRFAVPTLVLFLALNLAVAFAQVRAAPANAANVFGPARQF
jgi:hypothetical protein